MKKHPVTMLTIAGLLVLWQASSVLAQLPDPLGPIQSVLEKDDAPAEQSTGATPSATASGTVLQVNAFGGEVVTVGSTESRSGQDGSWSSDVTLLSVAGHEILGSHSSAEQGAGSSTSHVLAPVCEETDGGICLGLLFSDASGSGDGSADADAALAFACVGGTQTRWEGTCDGLVGLEVGGSHSETFGGAAHQQTGVVEACLGGESEGQCSGLGASLLTSESSSSSGGSDGSSSLLAVDAGGNEVAALSSSAEISVPPGCPPDPGSLACVALNQGETTSNGNSQIVADVEVLRTDSLGGSAADGGVSSASTSSGAEEAALVAAGGDDVVGGATERGAGAAADTEVPGGGLADTGFATSLILGLALGSIALGVTARRMGRRRS